MSEIGNDRPSGNADAAVVKFGEHEYVDLMLDVKNGQVVSCELHGEGHQVEPLTEPVLFKLLEGEQWPSGWKRVERRIKMAFRNIAKATASP